MSKYCAVLMDVVSIQKYVFGSNQLKDNLGASYIVKTLFSDFASPIFQEVFNLGQAQTDKILSAWQKEPETILLQLDSNIPFEIGAADGGNALILFREAKKAEKFIKAFTKKLLLFSPEIRLAVARKDDFSIEEKFKTDFTNLNKELIKNRNRFLPITDLPNHGITASYSQVGETINAITQIADEIKFLPIGKFTKVEKAKNEEEEKERELKERNDNFTFTNLVTGLGQTEGQDYLAVVHIDGNNIGDWFKKSTSLVDYRRRSVLMSKTTEEAFWEMVATACNVVETINQLKKEKEVKHLDGFKIDKKNGKEILPIRPVILGGDDVTFICHGQLALYLAEKFISIWVEKANDEQIGLASIGREKRDFSACAGIAITNTKYPLYRTYRMAEESCSIAKETHREKNCSWLDFYIMRGTKSGHLKDIRNEELNVNGVRLYHGPYKISERTSDFRTTNSIKQSIKHFKTGETGKFWPENKLKELRTVLYLGEEAAEAFYNHMSKQGVTLPDKDLARFEHKFIADMETPYHDILEAMEFYPVWLLQLGKGEKDSANS